MFQLSLEVEVEQLIYLIVHKDDLFTVFLLGQNSLLCQVSAVIRHSVSLSSPARVIITFWAAAFGTLFLRFADTSANRMSTVKSPLSCEGESRCDEQVSDGKKVLELTTGVWTVDLLRQIREEGKIDTTRTHSFKILSYHLDTSAFRTLCVNSH